MKSELVAKRISKLIEATFDDCKIIGQDNRVNWFQSFGGYKCKSSDYKGTVLLEIALPNLQANIILPDCDSFKTYIDVSNYFWNDLSCVLIKMITTSNMLGELREEMYNRNTECDGLRFNKRVGLIEITDDDEVGFNEHAEDRTQMVKEELAKIGQKI